MLFTLRVPWIHRGRTPATSHLPPHTISLGLSQCTSPKHPVSCIELRLVIRFLYDIVHVSMPFSQIILPSPSPTESKRLFYTSVSLLLSRIQGYHYHLSKFHIYVLVYLLVFFFMAYFTLYNRLHLYFRWYKIISLSPLYLKLLLETMSFFVYHFKLSLFCHNESYKIDHVFLSGLVSRKLEAKVNAQ